MFGPIRYLRWAMRFFGKVEFDLAVSGVLSVTRAELGDPPALDDPAGPSALREALAAFHRCEASEVVATLGTSQALWLALATLVGPGDDVLVEEPTYEPLVRVPEGLGARVVRFSRIAADGYALDLARVEAAFTPATRVVVVTNRHNPSGARTERSRLVELATLAARRGATLLVDEVYAPFDVLVDAGRWPNGARSLHPSIVTVASLTKCFGTGRERIGWLVADRATIERAEDALLASVGFLPLGHANYARHALAHIDLLAERARRLLGDKRARVEAWMRARPELTWSAPDGGLFGFAISSRAGDLTPAIELGATELGVIVAPGSFFGVPNGFRLSWSIADDKLDEALARLAKVLPQGE